MVNGIHLYPRWCSFTGEGMTSGYCIHDGEAYTHSESILVDYLRDEHEWGNARPANLQRMPVSDLLQLAYDQAIVYWTNWFDEPRELWHEPPTPAQMSDPVKAAAELRLCGYDATQIGDKVTVTVWNNDLSDTVDMMVHPTEVHGYARNYESRTFV